jgi:hypothetical protein
VKPFEHLCNDPVYWSTRAQIRYGMDPRTFEAGRDIAGTTVKGPPTARYFEILLHYLDPSDSKVTDKQYSRAHQEINDLRDIVVTFLRRQALRRAENPVVYYAIAKDEDQLDNGYLYPASSNAEALLECGNPFLRIKTSIL